jgi:D-sedoheptulose 7-phosphate isomerase
MAALRYHEDYSRTLGLTLSRLPLDRLPVLIDWLRDVRDQNHQIFVCGNGGSAMTASHFVTDMVKGASLGKAKRFRIYSLTDSIPTITAYANDISYDLVFAEHLKNLAQPGDLVIAISGSGQSVNVTRAVEYAKTAGCRTVSLTGRNGGDLAKVAHLDLNVPEQHMGRIEDAHMILCHMICYYFMDAESSEEMVQPEGLFAAAQVA